MYLKLASNASIIIFACLVVLGNSLCFRGFWFGPQWIPDKGCPLRWFTRDEAAQCLDGKGVFFGGSSVSRHVFVGMLKLLKGEADDTSQKARLEEKHHFSNLGKIFNTTGSAANLECERKRKQYTDENYEFCMFNANYVDHSITEVWKFGNFSGNVTFMWLVDWFVPIIAQKLMETHTIVSTNAGLNKEWEFDSKWDIRYPPMQVLSKEFPRLWSSNIAESSMLLYRQTTESCSSSENLKKQNSWIRDYAKRFPDPRMHILDFDEFTKERLHYIDCNHHPGAPAMLEVQSMLNVICPEIGTTVSRDDLLRKFENTITTHPLSKQILLYLNSSLHHIPDLDTFHAGGYFKLKSNVLSLQNSLPQGSAIRPMDCPRWTGSACVNVR